MQLVFVRESNPNFPWEKFPLGHQSVKKKIYIYIILVKSINFIVPTVKKILDKTVDECLNQKKNEP